MNDPANFYARLASVIKAEELQDKAYLEEKRKEQEESERWQKIVASEIP